MIPKVIHYCWFGGNPLPDLAVKCIDSWKKYFPDYEIIEWNENNWDCECCDYVKEAYEKKKWAFVSDYARFDILYKYGGIYFDTDVEVIKSFEDIIQAGAFLGCEREGSASIAPGLGMGAEPGLPLYKMVLEDYEKSHFRVGNKIDTTTICERITRILEQYGYNISENKVCINNINIYPWEFFGPMNYSTGEITITSNTHSIHWYDASWQSLNERMLINIQRFFSNKGKLMEIIGKIIVIPFKIIRKLSNK